MRNPYKRLLSALEVELVASGLPSRRKVKALFKALGQGKAPRGAGLKEGVLATVARGLYVTTERQKFSSEKEVESWLEQIRGSRFKIRPALTEVLKKVKAMSPRRGGPGRNPRFTKLEKRRICSTIGAFVASGMTVRDAVGQIAKHNKVGTRTIWKVWSQRAAW